MKSIGQTMESWTRSATIRLLCMLRGIYDSLIHGLPLFQREMLEQSHRGRTFILRATFACALFMVALFYSSASSGTSLLATAFGMTGQGRAIMQSLVWMLFLAIYLFGPALACGALTAEKERDTLTLLYLTRLGPWHVVLEKFLSRVAPMIGLLFLALPLLAFAYAFGGLTRNMIGTAMWFLLLTVIQVTTVSVMCSALCRTTAQSFLWTYLILFLMSYGFDLADHWFFQNRGSQAVAQWERDSWTPQRPRLLGKTYEIQPTFVSGQINGQNISLSRPALVNFLCGPILFSQYEFESAAWADHTLAYVTFFYREFPIGLSPATVAGIPILISALLSLFVARLFVFRHATTVATGQLFELARWRSWPIWRADSFARSLAEQSLAPSATPQVGIPIAWRESTRGFWGRTGGILLLLALIEIPTAAVILALMPMKSSTPISELILCLWALSTLLITVHASMLITKERSRQTLELLLTTPLTSAEIARQKFAGTQRLMLLCAVPLLTCIIFQSWWRMVLPQPIRIPPLRPFDSLEYLLTAIVCLAIYLPIVGWIALWMGMKFQHATRATMAAIGAIGGFCFAAIVVMMMVIALVTPVRTVTGVDIVPLIVTSTSPIAMLYAIEFAPLREISSIPYLPLVLNMSVYGIVYLWVRQKVLERSEFYLGRKTEY